MIHSKDKLILVTGALSGIGAACSKLLSELGATVILTARNSEKLQSVQEQLSGAYHNFINMIYTILLILKILSIK